MKKIYLDNAATTCPHPRVIARMCQALESGYANPSALYNLGIDMEKQIEGARSHIAKTLGAASEEIIFTSGGTEGDNTIIKGLVEIKRPDVLKTARIVTTTIEHPAVKDVFKLYEEHGVDVVWLPVDSQGHVDLAALEAAVDHRTILVSIIGVNNEIGTIQDLKKIGSIIKGANPDCVFHTDYVQGYMKEPLDVAACKLDAVTLCGHKICGPKGIGAIYLKGGLRIKPLLLGGGQEGGLRSGTENTPAILGFDEAITVMEKDPQSLHGRMVAYKAIMLEALNGIEGIRFNGDPQGSPYVLSASIPGIRGEVLLHSLEARGVYVSTGSACSSHKKEKQSVLKAIHLPMDLAEGTIRISFSVLTTETEVREGAAVIAEEAAKLQKWMNFKKK